MIYARKRLETENGALELEYEILVELLERTNGCPLCETYGARIVLKKENGEKESETVTDITTNPSEMYQIMKRLADGSVTPISLPEIVYDILCEVPCDHFPLSQPVRMRYNAC